MSVDNNPTFWGPQDVVSLSGVDLDSTAMLPNGGYIVAFRKDQKIGFQIYDGNGDKVGATQFVAAPASATYGQWEPDVYAKPDGTFVISWTEAVSSSGGGRFVRTQSFSSNGTPGTPETLTTLAQNDGVHVASNGSGGFVTAYIDDVLEGTSHVSKLTLFETRADGIITTSVVTDASGKTNVDWLGNGNGYVVSYFKSGFNVGVFNNGSLIKTTFQNGVEGNVVALESANGVPNGKFAAILLTDANDIVAKTFHVEGNAVVEDTTVTLSSGSLDSSGYKTSITALHDGGYAVAYKVGTGQADIWVKVFDASGAAGPAIQIPVYGLQVTPSISEMADGRLSVSWVNRSPATGGSAVETTIIDARATAVHVTGTDANDIYAPSKHQGDDFDGGAGFDTLTFKGASSGVAADLVAGNGSAGDAAGDTYKNFEKVIGTTFNDTLTGGAGHVLVGGAGNDVYGVSASDTVIDESGGGYDQVYASASYVLSAGIEDLIATGTDAINLTGNASNNTVLGNEADNQLQGLGGNDVLRGNGGNDTLYGGDGEDDLGGGDGNDILDGGAGIDILDGGIGNDGLYGGDGNDSLFGGEGSDTLDGGNGDDWMNGGAGADVMKGGDGNDTYIIDDVNDVIYDTSGVDTVYLYVDYDVSKLDGIENITGAGSASITLKGNAANNTLIGNDGANILYGGAGNDVLRGGAGNDRIHGEAGRDILYGDAGRDIFVFDTPLSRSKAVNRANIDKIADYNVRDDSIYMENKVFKALGKQGSLAHPKAIARGFFHVGAQAHDANDHIIYNKKTGALYYDADGTGHQAQIQIATLSKNLKMNYHDFFVI